MKVTPNLPNMKHHVLSLTNHLVIKTELYSLKIDLAVFTGSIQANLTVCFEREAEVQSAYLHCSVFINGEQVRSLIPTIRPSIKLTK